MEPIIIYIYSVIDKKEIPSSIVVGCQPGESKVEFEPSLWVSYGDRTIFISEAHTKKLRDYLNEVIAVKTNKE